MGYITGPFVGSLFEKIMARKRDPRTGRFLPKDWKGSYRDVATGEYRTGNNRKTTKDKAIKNVIEYTRRNPEKRRYTRRKAVPEYIPGLAHGNKLDPEQKVTDFALSSGNPDSYYIIYVDVASDEFNYGGESAGKKTISLTLGTYKLSNFDSQTRRQIREDIQNGTWDDRYPPAEVRGFWRSPKPLRTE